MQDFEGLVRGARFMALLWYMSRPKIRLATIKTLPYDGQHFGLGSQARNSLIIRKGRIVHNISVFKAFLVIDLARMRFIDASGINVLVSAARRAHARGGSLVLRSPNRAARRLLDVLHLNEVLAVESPEPGNEVLARR
jgi:ABC-type transporter Mla MlaB component